MKGEKMTVENSVSTTPKLVMGVKTYNFNFDVLLEDPTPEEAKRGIKCSISDGENETELIYGTDYTVSLNSNGKGGVVTVNDAKNNKWVIVIRRDYSITQGIDLNDYNEFPAETIERAFDKQTMVIQQLKDITDRCVKVTPTDEQTPEDLLEEVYSKLDTATEVANRAIDAAEQAFDAAEQAFDAAKEAKQSVVLAEQQVVRIEAFVEEKRVEINNSINNAENTINDIVTDAEKRVDDIVDNAASVAATKASETARIWAEGDDDDVKTLGGTHSSMVSAELSYSYANAPEDMPVEEFMIKQGIVIDSDVTKEYVDNKIGSIDFALDVINGEVI